MLCECPFFESEGPCKHLWATILAAEAKGFLSDAAALRDVAVEYTPNGDGDPGEPDLTAPRYPPRPAAPPQPTAPAWRKQLTEIARPPAQTVWDYPAPWPDKRQILYIVDVQASLAAGGVVVSLASRDRKADGSFSRSNSLTPKRYHVERLPLAEDREILAMLAGGTRHYSWSYVNVHEQIPDSYVLPGAVAEKILRQAVHTGRCYLRTSLKEEDVALTWDEGDAWRFRLQMNRSGRKGWAVSGMLRRGEEHLDLTETVLVTPGFVFTREHVARLAPDTPVAWISHLRKIGSIEAPDKEKDDLLAALLGAPGIPALEVPRNCDMKK